MVRPATSFAASSRTLRPTRLPCWPRPSPPSAASSAAAAASRLKPTADDCNLYVALVGPTGKARKGVSLSHSKAALNADADWVRGCVKTGFSTGEGLLHAVRDGRGVDGGVADKRLLAVEPEFATLLRHMERQGNILSSSSSTLRQPARTRNADPQQPDQGHRRPRQRHRPRRRRGAAPLPVVHRNGQRLRQPLHLARRPPLRNSCRRRPRPAGSHAAAPGQVPRRGRVRRRQGAIAFDDEARRRPARNLPATLRRAPRTVRRHAGQSRGPGAAPGHRVCPDRPVAQLRARTPASGPGLVGLLAEERLLHLRRGDRRPHRRRA